MGVKKSQKEWLPILVHETCHLDQWIEDADKFMEDDGINIVDEWLSGKDIDAKIILDAINASRYLELDCEKRSVEKIKKYRLPVDVENYIKMSNTYVYFYQWVLENRKWVPEGKSLFVNEIVSLAPKTWQESYDIVPKNMNDAFNKHLL